MSRAPLQGILQNVLMWAPALKSARLSRRIPPKLSLAAMIRLGITNVSNGVGGLMQHIKLGVIETKNVENQITNWTLIYIYNIGRRSYFQNVLKHSVNTGKS